MAIARKHRYIYVIGLRVPTAFFSCPPSFSFECVYFDLSLSYVIAFQKAKESVYYFLSLRSISFEFTCRHNIIEAF